MASDWKRVLRAWVAVGVVATVIGCIAPASSTPIASGFNVAPTGPTERAHVVRVVDGDTIIVDRGHGNERLRYIGINTPEAVDPNSPVEWIGPEASEANKRLVEGRDVVLERDVSERDQYGRLLRYVWFEDQTAPSGWVFVTLELVLQGYAQVDTFPPDVKYVDLYRTAAKRARDLGLGLWGAHT